ATWGAGFSGAAPDADHAVANFGSTASAQTVTVEGAGRTVGVLDISSTNAYTFSGGTLTLNDSFAPDPNLPPPPSSPPSLTSDTTADGITRWRAARRSPATAPSPCATISSRAVHRPRNRVKSPHGMHPFSRPETVASERSPWTASP